LKDPIKELNDVIDSKDEEIEKLNDEIKRLVDCVAFYATCGIDDDRHDFFIIKDLKISVPTNKRAKHIYSMYINRVLRYACKT
jgi:hypothetical protein